MSEPIFQNWTSDVTARWGKAPLRVQHRLHEHPLFALEALEQLIEAYPREHYALVHMGAQGSPKRSWREGEIGKLSGKQVIEAIRNGRMWLNLRNVGSVDARYGEVLEQAFGEVDINTGGYQTSNRTSGILISSPNAQVYYHADLPGQSLWQIHGRKRVYVYPNSAPFITPQQLENIALYEVEVDMRYDPAFDKDADVFEIGGGEMLHWPLNAPHRVENLDSLNVSMTTEYWTESIRRKQMINVANGILRHKLGVQPKSRAIEGPGFWAKAVLQAGVKRSGLLKTARRSRRPVVFRLDPKRPGAIIDLEAAAE
jgi:hypothetical protein